MKTRYYERLPRKGDFTYQTCCNLDDHGDRCPRQAEVETYSFEDRSTIPHNASNWNVIYLCGKHAQERKINTEESQNYN